jgi:hypothetical protein
MANLLHSGVNVSSMRIVLLLWLVFLGAGVSAQVPSGNRRDPGTGQVAQEQRRAELRSALTPLPATPRPGVDERQPNPEASQPEPKRQLSEEERLNLRRQLRQQATSPFKPDGPDSRAPSVCNRGPADKSTRSSNDTCY